MKEKIKLFINQYQEINKKINPSIFATSLVYYFIIVFIPLINYVFYILNKLELLEINLDSSFSKLSGLSLLIFLFNLVYVSSKIVHNLRMMSKLIYQEDDKYFFLVERIKSISLMVFLFLVIIGCIICELYLNYLFNTFLTKLILLKNIIIVFFRFIVISFFLSVLLKKIIPVHIKIIETFKVSVVVTFISYVLINLYKFFYSIFGTIGYQNLYGSLYQIFILLVLLYLLFLVFIHAIIFEFIVYKTKNIEYTNSEHERGV